MQQQQTTSRLQHLALRVQHLAPSATLAVNTEAQRLAAKGVDVLNFTAGEPDMVPAVHIQKAAKEAIALGKHLYTPGAGITELCDAVAQQWATQNYIPTTADRVVVTNGGKEALYLTFQTILSPGDEVIIASPTWVSFSEQIRLAGGTVVSVKTNEKFHLTATAVTQYITPHTVALVLNSPANPTGAVLSQKEIEALAALAEQHDLWIIADEVYERFLYDGRTHTSVASLPDMAKRTITVNACSKTYSMTGWRVGYVTAPAEVVAAIKKLKDHTSSNVNVIAQYAALAALTGPQEYVEQMRQQFDQRRHTLCEGINSIPGFHLNPPEGAFYGFIDAHGVMERLNIANATALCKWVLQHARVALVPGEAFGKEWLSYVRWSFAIDAAIIEEGIQRLKDALTEHVN